MCREGLVVVEYRLPTDAPGNRLRPNLHDGRVDLVHLGAEGVVVHRQRRRLNDDQFGQRLGPSQPVFEQGRCAF